MSDQFSDDWQAVYDKIRIAAVRVQRKRGYDTCIDRSDGIEKSDESGTAKGGSEVCRPGVWIVLEDLAA